MECIPEPSYQTPSFLSCEPVTNGFPSLRAAFPHLIKPSYLRICSGSRCTILHSSLLSFSPYITCREYPHILPFLHTAPCKCKCKTFLLPNFSLSSSHLSLLDSTPWRCKIISSSATMLGLFLHSPQSQPTPLYDEQMSPLPLSPPFTRSTIEAAQLRKPIATMQKRTRACSALGLSFRDRTIFLSFYVLSLPVYHHSTLLPSSPFYRTYFTLIRRLLAPRHWIQASQLPGIVTYLRLGILHCPHIHLTCSLLGYCLRCYGEPIALWLCYVTPALPPICLPNSAKGYTPFVGCFSPPTLTTLSLSSTLFNVTFTTTIHPINSHVWYFLTLKSIYDNSSFTVLALFFVNASVRLIGLSLPHLLPLRPSMLPLSKLSPPFLVWPFFVGLLTPNLTSIFDSGHTSLGPLPVAADVANFLPYSHLGSSLALSTTRTSLFPSLGLYLLVHPCSLHSPTFSENNILLSPLSLPLLSGIPAMVLKLLP